MKYVSNNKLFLLCLISILFGCEKWEKKVEFKETTKGRKINLSQKLGNTFSIVRHNDTIEYKLTYDKVTGQNYLMDDKLDTLFYGTITKRNELFLLNRKLSNKNYSIHALRFTDSSVTGLGTENLQLALIKKELKKEQNQYLLMDTTDSYLVKLNRKEGKNFFRKAMEQLTPEVRIGGKKMMHLSSAEKGKIDTNMKELKVNLNVLIDKVYPNPFKNQVTVLLNKEASYVFKMFDKNGQLIKVIKKNTDKQIIDLVGNASGYYFLKVLDSKSLLLDEFKLYKK